MKRLAKPFQVIIESEAQKFEELAVRLYFSWRNFYKAKLSLKRTGHCMVDVFNKKNYEKIKNEMEEIHINNLKESYIETKEPYLEIEGFCFPDNIIFSAAIDLFSVSEPQVSDIKNLKENSERVNQLLSFKSYLISRLYKNFDVVCSVMEVKPDDLFHDIWLLGDTIKTDSHFLIGYRLRAMKSILKANLSAKAKTKKAEKNIQIVKSLLLEKYNNKASPDFIIDAMKATRRGERTIKDMVKKIRKELGKGKTDGIS